MFGFSSMPRELGHEHTWQTGGPASFGQGLPSDSQPGLTLELSPEPRETDSQASSNPRDSDRMGGGAGLGIRSSKSSPGDSDGQPEWEMLQGEHNALTFQMFLLINISLGFTSPGVAPGLHWHHLPHAPFICGTSFLGCPKVPLTS